MLANHWTYSKEGQRPSLASRDPAALLCRPQACPSQKPKNVVKNDNDDDEVDEDDESVDDDVDDDVESASSQVL